MATPKNKPAAKKKPAPPKAAPQKASGKAAQKSTPARTEKLKTITPSGKREETFFELVYEVARQIPKGRVTSYGAIAASLGAKSSARMVGWAMNGAHKLKHKVPAHRVVNSSGLLSGQHHFHPPGRMQQLLEKEDIRVIENKVADFKKHFWNPAEELF